MVLSRYTRNFLLSFMVVMHICVSVCGERERECVCMYVCMYVERNQEKRERERERERVYLYMYVCREQSRKVCYLSNNHNGTKRVGSRSCVLVVKNHLLSSLPTTICNHPKRKGLLVGLLSLWSLQFANLKLKNWFDTGP